MKHSVAKQVSNSNLNHTSFFQKESGQNFFNSPSIQPSFFTGTNAKSPPIQTKLTIGEPHDKYEHEADAVADKVVQRLAIPEVQPKQDRSIQQKPVAASITQLIQTKPAPAIELQKKETEEDDMLQEASADVQLKPIFETAAEPPDESGADDSVQRKCAACEREDKLQKKDEESEQDKLQLKPIFESNAQRDDKNNIQRKCAECEKEDKLQKKEDDKEKDKLQRKPIFESNAQRDDESNVQRKCAECEKEEKLQKKEEEEQNQDIQRTPIFEKSGEADDDHAQRKHGQGEQEKPVLKNQPERATQQQRLLPVFDGKAAPASGNLTVQAKCAECTEEEKLQEKEEELPKQERQRKPVFDTISGPPADASTVQKKCTECEKEEQVQRKEGSDAHNASPSIEGQLSSSKGAGKPLHDSVRGSMESSFGADFSSVRIHTDSGAVQMSKDLNAQAFTHGSDIYFNSGKFDTNNQVGQKLIAHELTHVIQQAKKNTIISKSIQRSPGGNPSASSLPKIEPSSLPVIWTKTKLPLSGGKDVFVFRGFADNVGKRLAGQILLEDATGGTLSRSIDAAHDAIFNWIERTPKLTGPDVGGVIRVRIPAAIWDELVRTYNISERPYPGFSRALKSTEIRVNSVEAIRLINSLSKDVIPPDPYYNFQVPAGTRPSAPKPIPEPPATIVPGEVPPTEFSVKTEYRVLNTSRIPGSKNMVVEVETILGEGLDALNKTATANKALAIPKRIIVRITVNPQGALVAAESASGESSNLIKFLGKRALETAPKAPGVSPWLRGASWAGLLLFVGFTWYKYNKASDEDKPKVLWEAGGAFLGGMGSSYLVCNLILGFETLGWSLLICGAIAGVPGAIAGEAVAEVAYEEATIDDDEIREWAAKSSFEQIRIVPFNEKLKLIFSLMKGWVSDDDVDAIVKILGSINNESELRALDKLIDPQLIYLNSFGQRTRIRGALVRRIDTKLIAGGVASAAEKEADLMADSVVNELTMPLANIDKSNRANNSTIQPKSAESKNEDEIQTQENSSTPAPVSSAIETNLSSSKSSGSRLPQDARLQMEDSFGADFSDVRIHNDSAAEQMNNELNAQAFTHGNDIYFNAGKYDLSSKGGKHLLAHELTHAVQQNSSAQLRPLIQRRTIDPHQVMDDIFNDGRGRSLLKVPLQYWLAYRDTAWFDGFTEFLKRCAIDPDTIDERPLVYMALLYSTLPKQPEGWDNAIFQMTSTDYLGSLLNVQFKLPKDVSGEMGVSIYFSSPKDQVQLDSTTKVLSGVFHPLVALSFTMPDTDFASFQQSFQYKLDAGAYKGNGANFQLTYVLFSPRSPLKLQTVYFNERIEFSLVSKEKLEVSFKGKFDIAPNLTLDTKNFDQVEKLMPRLIKNAVNLDSSLGGIHSSGEEIETLVMGFSQDKYKIVSLQQLLDPTVDSISRAQFFTYRMLTLMESFRMGESLITKDEPPVHLSFNSLKDAQARAGGDASPGYMIILQEKKYIVYFLTSTDLAWLAKKERGEDPATLPRYVGIDLDSMVELDFFGCGNQLTVRDKRSMLSVSYFSSQKELGDYSDLDNYFVAHRLPDGYYGEYPLSKDEAAGLWKVSDQANRVIAWITGRGEKLDVGAIYVSSDEEGAASWLIVDDEHYEGRKEFAKLYYALDNATDLSKIGAEIQKFDDPLVLKYVVNELMRPNSMNPNQGFKEALKKLQGIGGGALVETIGTRAFAMVAGEAERKGLEMMESMLTFMDEMLNDDLIMKAMLMSFRSRADAEKKEIAGIFTSSADEAARLIKIMENDETMNEFLMGNTVDKLSLTTVVESLTRSRDEIKTAVDDRRELQKNPTIRYESLFIVQPGELGNTIREHVYDVFGFKLDPKAFPHEDQNSSWFPSPLEENGKSRRNLLEQLYINEAINITHKFKLLKTAQTVAMVASVFSLARGAGLWAVARAGLVAGTAKAILLEALVTSVVAGVMLEGIQVALGKKFSWKDLGWSIGEAFLMMLVFGWINSLFKLPLTKFTVNAFLFVGYGVGRFYLEKKRMPNSFEFGMLVFESVLMMTLLHIGTKITDPFFRRVLAKYAVDPELRVISENLQKIVKDIAIEAAKKSVDKARIRELGDQYMEYVKLYRAWLLKNQGKFAKEDIDAELAKLNELEGNWNEARFVDVTGLTKVAQTNTAFYYKPGADSVKALKERYGEGNVQIDEKTGMGNVKTPEGNVKLIPQDTAKQAGDLTVDGKQISDIFGNAIRMIDLGVYAFGKGNLDAIKGEILKRPNGKWEDLGDKVYAGTIGGRRVIFIEEGATLTLDQAISMETQAKGAGMDYLGKSLSDAALKGLEILKNGELKNMSDLDIIKYLKQVSEGIQDKKYPKGPEGEPLNPRPKSFNEYLEKLYFDARLKEIKDFRQQEDVVPYKQTDGDTGTVAMFKDGPNKYFGANSTLENAAGKKVRSLPKAEVDAWIQKLISSGKIKEVADGEFLYHAEAEALINAYKAGVKFPEEASLFVDRPTCNRACAKNLGGLLDLLGIKTLRIYWQSAGKTPGMTINASSK